jgi:hypothetical protein
MSSMSYWPKPPRLVASNDSTELVRWYLRLAIICMEDGSATTLANRIGVTPNTIHLAVHRGTCTDDLAKRIEKLFGRKYFPRELFIPEPELPVE